MKPDRFLLSFRTGRWRWPWAILGTALTLSLVIAIGLITEPIENRLAMRFGHSTPGTDLLPGRPDTFVSFLFFALSVSLAPSLVAAGLHGVDPRRLLGPESRFDWGQMLKASAALVAVMGAGLVIGLFREPQNYAWLSRDTSQLPWLAVAAALILYQSFAEEYLFKGYLFRVWGAVLPIRTLIVVTVAAVFTSAHAINDDVATDLAFNLIFFFAGELVTLLVYLRTESLGAVTGLHWINNVWAMCILPTQPGQSTALAIAAYTDPVLSAGASRLTDPKSYLEVAAGLMFLLVLLCWKKSPFYLPPHRPVEPGPQGNSPPAPPVEHPAGPPPGEA